MSYPGVSRPTTGYSDPSVPFLPGNSITDITRANFRKSHAFDIRAGTPISNDVPRKDYPAAPQPGNANPTVQGDFVPAFAGLEGKVLRFEAFTSEQVPENLTQPSRIRKFTICYYLVDDSIQINEHREQNSGYAQGLFMKRHRVAKRGRNGEEFVTLFDFADSKVVAIYNREFHLTGCNGFTSEFFRVNGLKLSLESSVPVDQYTAQRASLSRLSTRSATPAGDGRSSAEMLRPGSTMSMSSVGSVAKRDMREKFLKYANKVLRFYAFWDDRGTMFGERMEYVINYFLADDKVEVLEVKRHNSGRDPFPKLVKKQRIPRHFQGVPSVGSKEADFEDEYLHEGDFVVGEPVEIFGRELQIYDCDPFTREYYRQQRGFVQPEARLEQEPLVEFPNLELPPYNGFGSEPDSIASYLTLIPKQRFGFLTDPDRAMRLDTVVLRWRARFDLDRMNMPSADDGKRRFVVSLFMGDGSVSVYEPPVPNSGFMGGKFLERQRVLRHGQRIGSGEWMDKEDFPAELPGTVWINGFPFVLFDADKFTLRHLGNGRQIVDVAAVHGKVRRAAGGSPAGLLKAFRALDAGDTGLVSLEGLVAALRRLSLDVDEDELVALIGEWDTEKTGAVRYRDFLAAVFP